MPKSKPPMKVFNLHKTQSLEETGFVLLLAARHTLRLLHIALERGICFALAVETERWNHLFYYPDWDGRVLFLRDFLAERTSGSNM